MPEFRYVSLDEPASRLHTRNVETPARPPSQEISMRNALPRQQRNVESVLSLGDVRYVMFQRRTYRVPAVPFTLGQRVLDLQVKVLTAAKQVELNGDPKAQETYFREMKKLSRVLWNHMRPIGKFRRIMWRLGMLKNPFSDASEREVRDLTDFFLQGRMMSSVRLTSEKET